MPSAPLAIVVLISGGGTSLQNLVDRIADGRLTGIRIAGVVSSRSTVAGVQRARDAGLPLEVIRPRDHADVELFSRRIANIAEQRGAQLIVQAGWLCYWQPPAAWRGRVINIHPALLPHFGGKGMYGRHVHAAVLAARRRISGATVHLVDDQFDHGPIILQAACPVRPGDTPDTLAARVFAVECDLLPRALELARDNRLPVFE